MLAQIFKVKREYTYNNYEVPQEHYSIFEHIVPKTSKK